MKRLFGKKTKGDAGTLPSSNTEIDETAAPRAETVSSSQLDTAQESSQQQQPLPSRRHGFGFGRHKDPGVVSSNEVSRSNSFANAAQPPANFAEQTIGYLVGTGRDDWTRALLLADSVSQSDDQAKEASKALRKELEYAAPDARIRDIRLLVILMRNSTDRFRMKIASKKFLDVVEKVHRSKQTPPEVRAAIVKAFCVMGYEYKDDA